MRAVAEFLLGRPDLAQKYHRIERAILLAQLLFYSWCDLRMRQRPLRGRRRSMMAPTDYCKGENYLAGHILFRNRHSDTKARM